MGEAITFFEEKDSGVFTSAWSVIHGELLRGLSPPHPHPKLGMMPCCYSGSVWVLQDYCCLMHLPIAGQLRRVANMMQSAGMEVPDWMRNLRKEKPHLKQLKHDKRKAAAAAVAPKSQQQQQHKKKKRGKL